MSQDPLQNQAEKAEAFRRGDSAVLTAVYRETVKSVGNLVLRGFASSGQKGNFRVLGLRDQEEQQDIVQEVYLRAFKDSARNVYDVNQPYRAYLLRIAKNLMIDRLRKKGRRPKQVMGNDFLDVDEIIENNAPVAAFSDVQADRNKLKTATFKFLDSCDAQTKEFIRLRFEEGMSQIAVAEKLGVSRRFIRTAEEKARKSLERSLKGDGLLHLISEDHKVGPESVRSA